MALDVYGLTRQRDASTLNRFLDEYVDRAGNADRGDEELMLESLAAHSGEMERSEGEHWEWELSRTLSHILERGLAYPRRAFTAYFTCLPACQDVGIERAILGFTRDDQLVLGLSVSTGEHVQEEEWEAGETRAHELLAHFAEAYQCHLGLILLETPPPLSEAEFRQPSETLRVAFHTSFDA
jgi:hypothetical protein